MRIQRFNEFDNKVNEGLSDIVKKIPFISKYYTKAEKIAKSVKSKVENLIKDLSEEDKSKIYSFTIDQISPGELSKLKTENKKFESKKDGESDLIGKILKVIGIGAGSASFISGLVSMIINTTHQHGGDAEPWFIAFVALLAISGISGATKQVREIEESIVTYDDIDTLDDEDSQNVWVLTVYDEDDNTVDTHEIVSEEEPTSQAFKYVENLPNYRDGWDWSLMKKSFFE